MRTDAYMNGSNDASRSSKDYSSNTSFNDTRSCASQRSLDMDRQGTSESQAYDDQNLDADNSMSEEDTAGQVSKREIRRFFVMVANKVVDVILQEKTLSVASFDRFKECFIDNAVELNKAQDRKIPVNEIKKLAEDSKTSDDFLRGLFFIVGGTFLGPFGSKQERQKRRERLEEQGIDLDDGQWGKISSRVYSEELDEVDESDEWTETNDSYGVSPGRFDERERYRQAEESEYQNNFVPSFRGEVPQGAYNQYDPDLRYAKSDSQWMANDIRLPEYDARRSRGNEVAGYEMCNDEPRGDFQEDFSTVPLSSGPSTSRSNGGGLSGFVRRRNEERQNARTVEQWGAIRDSVAEDPKASEFGAFVSAIPIEDAHANAFRANVGHVAELLSGYFEGKIVQGEYDLILLEQLMTLRDPGLRIDREQLITWISYAGGSYRRSNERVFTLAELESRHIPSKEEFEKEIAPLSPTEQKLMRDVFRILEEDFENFFVPVPQGLELIYATLPYLTPDFVNNIIHDAHGVIGKIAPSIDEAYLTIAKKVLRDSFPKKLFRKDGSDFGAFVASFNKLAGGGANVDSAKLRTICEMAGARFTLEAPKPQVEETQVVAPQISRANAIKKIVTTTFVHGFDPTSKEQLALMRKEALTKFNVDLDSVSDAQLVTSVARLCIQYDERLYLISDKDKDDLKKIIKNEVAAGAKIAFYDSLYERQKEWLGRIGIDSVEILTAFLAKFYSNCLFYPEYFVLEDDDKRSESDDRSDRRRVEDEILRVWTPCINQLGEKYYEEKSAAVLAMFVYIPQERIAKVLNLNEQLFEKTGNVDPQGNVLYARRDGNVLALETARYSSLCEEWDNEYEHAFSGEDLDSQEADAEVEEDSRDQEPVLEEALCDIDVEAQEEKYDQDDESEEYKKFENDNKDFVKKEYEKFENDNKDFVKKEIDNWFAQGGILVSCDGFIKRHKGRFTYYDYGKLWKLFKRLYINSCTFFVEEGYFTSRNADKVNTAELINEELERVWPVEQASRRIAELTRLTYLSTKLLEDYLDTLGIVKRSNGYLVREPKKAEGGKRTKRVLQKRRRAR